MRSMRFWYSLILLTALAAPGTRALFAQTAPETTDTYDQVAAVSPGNDDGAALPRSFRDFTLGMGLEDLKDALKKDGLFYFRGDRDVSFLPAREQSLVETLGLSFIRRAFFQLREGNLFVMAFSLNANLIDHYSVYTSFVKKYGEPEFIDPKQAVWETEDTRVAIERPLTVKYIDKRIFNEIISESRARESGEVFRRGEFLNDF